MITSKNGNGGQSYWGGGFTLMSNAVITPGASDIYLNWTAGGDDIEILADYDSYTTVNMSAKNDIIIDALVKSINADADINLTADNDHTGAGGVIIKDGGKLLAGQNVNLIGSDYSQTGGIIDSIHIEADTVSADADGSIQVEAGGNITLLSDTDALIPADDYDIFIAGQLKTTVSGGYIHIDADDQVQLSSTLTSANGEVRFYDATVLNGDAEVDTGAGSGNILFDSTINTGANKLTLNAGGGNITLSDTLSGTGTLEVADGATQNYAAMTLDSLDIQDAGSDVIFNGAVSATTIAVNSSDEISQTAGGSLTAATSITLDAINGIGDSGAGEAIVVSSPSITVTNTNSSGAIALESADSLSVGDKGSGAALGISQATGGIVEITATGGSDIDVAQNLTVGGAGRIVLDADTGSITESGGKLNTKNLELIADAGITANILSLSSVNLAAQIAAGGSGIDITSQVLGGDLTVANVAGITGITGISSSGSNISLTGTQGNLVINQGMSAGTGVVAITVGNGTLTNNSSIAGSGGITLSADSMALGGSINGGAGIVNLLQKTNGQAIDLGTQDGSNLELTNAELNTVTADTLRIGNVNTGEITVTGNVDVTANVSNVKLTSGEGISYSSTAAITAGALALSAEGTIDLLTKVDTLAAETTLGGITVENTMVSGLTVGTVDGIVGIDTSNTALNLTETTGNITVAQAVNANSNTATITATAGNVNLNQQVNVGSGTVNVNTGGAVVLNSNINAAGGTVNITAAGRINNPSGVITANTTTLESTGAGIGIDNTINTATSGTLTLESGGNASAGDINVVESVITNTNKVGFTTNGTGNQNISLTFTGGTLTVGGNIGNETDNLSITANTGDMLDGGGVITANDLELTVLGNGASIGTAPVWNAQHTRIDTPSVPVRIVVQGTNNGLTVDASNGNGGIFLTVPESPVTANPNRPEELAAYQDQMSYNSLRYTTIDAGEGGDIGLTMTGWLDGAVNPDVYDEDGTTIGDNIFQPTNLPEYTNSIDSWRDAGETGPIPDNYIRGDELMIEVGTIGLSAAPQADVQTIRLTVNDKGEHPVSTIPGDWSALIVVEDLYDTGGRLLDYPVPVNQLNATRPGNVRIGSGLVTPEQDFIIPLSVQSAAAAIPVFSPQQQSLEKLLSSAGGEDFFMTPPLWIDINMGGDEDFEEEDFGGEDEFSSNQRPYYYGTPDLKNVVDLPTLLGANQELGQGLLRLSALN
ncbi:beta strand repeat-containing protein [Thermodesulfobacteriota bacterium]